MGSTIRRVIVSAVVIVGILFITAVADLDVNSGGGLKSSISTSSATTSTEVTTSSSVNLTQQVLPQVTQFLEDLEKGNISAVERYYTDNSVLVLKGCTSGLGGGTYRGTSNIDGIYGEFNNGIAAFSFAPSELVLEPVDFSMVNASYHLDLKASGFFGSVNASVVVQQQWNHSSNTAQLASNSWTIGDDTWNFLKVTIHSPFIPSPSC